MTEVIQIEWLAENMEEAKEIATALVEKKLVACANLSPHVTSIFHYENKLEQAMEVKVCFKTKDTLFPQIQEFIEKTCSYDIPSILKMEIHEMNPAYLKWLKESLILS